MTEIGMRCFICLAETLNFSETATRMFMTQQAISKYIASLEDELGVLLIHRSKHGNSLTPEGKRCYMLFVDFIRNYDELRASVQVPTQNKETIHLGIQNWLNFGFCLSEISSALNKEIPNAEIECGTYQPDTLNHMLNHGDLDIALIQERFYCPDIHLSHIELIRSPMVLIASRTENMEYSQLFSMPYIVDRFETESETETLRRAHREAALCGLKPPSIIIKSTRDSVYIMVEAGQGIATSTTISQSMMQPKLCAFSLPIKEPLLCVWAKENNHPVVRTWVKNAKQVYKRMQNTTMPEAKP